MSNSLKLKIQNFMTKRYYKTYCRELSEQQNVYDVFMRKQEEKLRLEYENRKCKLTGKVITKTELPEIISRIGEIKEDVLVVVDENGVLNPIAMKVMLSYFDENKESHLLYADEDVCIGEGGALEKFLQNGVKLSARCYPNLKPIPAPETFLSYQYFGNVWAVRRELLEKIEAQENFEVTQMVDAPGNLEKKEVSVAQDIEILEYDLLLKAWELAGTQGVAHIPEILYHKFELLRMHTGTNKAYTREEMERALREEDAYMGAEEKFNGIKEAAFRRRGVALTMETSGSYSYPIYELSDNELKISILIPSKDNPEVLKKCISSVYEKSTYRNFEIIVIDNGSNEENRRQIETMREKYPFTYLYQPMEFNYSVMNNIAAKEATGEVLLLLNDDMEVVTPDWLERMVGQLLQEGIGAVGAKLLYPDSTLIQHVGITNAVDGPVHKLLKKDDTLSYNHGRNKLVYNVIGVTGACLMVRKEHFEYLGGLKEDLKVAYNDVDLCFSLYEMGLRNVARNDVVLYHHESLSRGADAMSEDKMKRLKWERDFLYNAHPELAYRDPYEGANNRGGEDFGLQIQPDYDAKKTVKEMPGEASTDYKAYPPGVHVGIDRVGREAGSSADGEAVYVVAGFAILPEADNCRYSFELVFSGENKTYYMPIQKKLRPNMSAGFPNARNVELCGFYCWVTETELPKGTYEIGIFAKDHCSRQRLFQKTGEVLNIE